MSQKRARSVEDDGIKVKYEKSKEFNFDSVRSGRASPGVTDLVLDVLRDMSACNRRGGVGGQVVKLSVREVYKWCLFGDTPRQIYDMFDSPKTIDPQSYAIKPEHKLLKDKMSETISAFFQEYLLYDKIHASVNRQNVCILSGSWILRCLIAFRCGICKMKMDKSIVLEDGTEISEIWYDNLPEREKTIFLENEVWFFFFKDLNGREEAQFLKCNKLYEVV